MNLLMLIFLEILVRKGAHLNTQNNLGNTPLHYAISYNFNDLVEILVKNGASQLIKNNDGKTPWDKI